MNWTTYPILAGLAACAVEPSLPVKTAAEETAECDDFLCTGNSPIVHGYKFYQLDEKKLLAKDGIKIKSLHKGPFALYDFDVIGARPQARGPSGELLMEHDLVNVVITLQTPPPWGDVDVTIKEYRPVAFYDGGPGPPISAFRLEYLVPGALRSVNTHPVNVCPYEEVNDEGIDGTWAIMSQGDLFDKVTTTITASGTDVGNWFNISCAGDVIAKLVRMRHAYAVQDRAHQTTKEQRQAALNMFTARYCDGGALYTQFGQPLAWEDFKPWHSLGEIATIEAVWDEHGAACLKKPRLFDIKDIACMIPECTTELLRNWRRENWLLSANPPPKP